MFKLKEEKKHSNIFKCKKDSRKKKRVLSFMNNISGNSPREKSKIDSWLQEEELPIILIQEYEIVSHIMGYHKYKSIWIPFVREKLTRQKEPENTFDKYAVAMIKNGSVVGNLMKVESEKFAKKFFISSSRTN